MRLLFMDANDDNYTPRNRGVVMGPHAPAKQQSARKMRTEMTPAENLLWQQVRGNRLAGLHFRRQQVIDGFIADFYCHAAGLIVEVDGSVHEAQADYDRQRDCILAARNLYILRFPNTRIEQELPAVLAEIKQIAQSRFPGSASAE